MLVKGANHVDRQLRLTPADYAAVPALFGREAELEFVVPAGGDQRSRDVAVVQHRLVVAWRSQDLSGSAVARRWGVSKQTISRTVRGHRWMGTIVASGLLVAAKSRQ